MDRGHEHRSGPSQTVRQQVRRTRRALAVAESGSARPPGKRRPDGLDTTDVRILSLLAEDARLSQRALARALGMSPAAVADRIARLETAGVIHGYHAEISPAALNRSLSVFVGISCAQGEDQRQLAARLLKLSTVESVDVVMGPVDLMVRVRAENHDHLREIFFDQILPLPGILRTESWVSLETLRPENFAKSVLDLM